jgi:hypothetical protein
MQSNRYSCPILIKLEFSRQIFRKQSNTNFQESNNNNKVYLTEIGLSPSGSGYYAYI